MSCSGGTPLDRAEELSRFVKAAEHRRPHRTRLRYASPRPCSLEVAGHEGRSIEGGIASPRGADAEGGT